ncbi:MAG TPA: tRNA pseudouridine(55) synthase TruB [Candidatus Marinimicrobia bacterium]|nr:tRNA pseudouridine(55) synthase TruB [Candidatus Neomarinimicrobiota bacterium]
MIININKPAGWTSFDVVKKVRGIIKEKKVGHAGTLDPFAEGVLVLGTGPDTKKLTDITTASKIYRAELTLGKATDTQDRDGKIIAESPVPELTRETIDAVLASFVGTQEQIPPMYSAKKVNGQRLYKLARKNKTVERDPVTITIDQISLLDYTEPVITFEVTCSKGTYVRALGADIAAKLGTVGHLTALVRTSVGAYHIANATTIEELSKS